MKKFCFVYLKRTNSLERYEIIPASLHPDFDELISSFKLFTKFELIDLNSIDSTTSLFITFESFDSNEMCQYDFINSFLKSISLKNVFFDLSSYDNQEIDEKYIDELCNLIEVEHYVISKNLIKNRDNQLWFEELMFHYMQPTSVIPQNILAFKQVEKASNEVLRKFKGIFYAGHTRIHKLQFLEFLYENDYLKDFIWASTGPDYKPHMFNDFIPVAFLDEYNDMKILEQLPHLNDYENYDRWRNSGNAYNFTTYLDSYFDVVAETRFYHIENSKGASNTFLNWNNISEKTMKPTLMGHPFIMISKPNTISMLEDMGLKYQYDFWNHSYNNIENDFERMDAVKEFTKKVMSLSKRELKEFREDYNNYTKDNFDVLNEIYRNSIVKIYEKA
jgi:hypothetical protein